MKGFGLFGVVVIGVVDAMSVADRPIGAESARRAYTGFEPAPRSVRLAPALLLTSAGSNPVIAGFLLLHGSGTSAGAFVNSPTAKGAKEFLQGVPSRVDAGGILIPPNWQYTAIDAASSDGGWWTGDYKGLEASIAFVEDAIVSNAAVGLIGHEQGATLAALVAARASLGLGPPLKFAVVCGADMPTAGSLGADLLESLKKTMPEDAIPTLHCISSANTAVPTEDAKMLAARFGESAEILWHDNGAAMPSRTWWEETQGYPDRCIGSNRWVTQFTGPFYYAQETKKPKA